MYGIIQQLSLKNILHQAHDVVIWNFKGKRVGF